jgi:hypothetical protein
MTRNDLIVLIPWAIVGVALILICIRLQISRRSSPHRPEPPSPQAQTSGEEPADDPETAAPDLVPPHRQQATSSLQLQGDQSQ